MLDFSGKIVLITGASSGIGEACAFEFASLGAHLILCARREDRLDALSSQLTQTYGVKSLQIPLDVCDKTAVEKQLSHLPKTWQAIDLLINNAGLALSSDLIQEGNIEEWDTMIDTNVKGLLYVSRYILPAMVARNHGHVVNIGSIAGQECYISGNVYCATKAAVKAISKSMRLDLLGKSIRVTEISPGAVETEFSEVRWKDKNRARQFYQDFEPLIAKDVADAVVYCATRPPHVNIAEMTIMPTAQASAQHIARKKR